VASVVLDPGSRCPCLSGNPYGECCGPLHAGATAPTAERLMRSRFSAFALGLPEYLLTTWHPRTRPATLELDASQRWTRLDIVATTAGGPFDTAGTVSFVAYWRSTAGSGASGSESGASASSSGSMSEVSSFVRESGRWFYVDGVVS
jgi:SEC-C motif domain protein